MARHLLAAAVLLSALALAVASPSDYEADSIIVRMEHGLASVHDSAFSVQSAAAADAAGELGKPIGRHLRRVKLQAGAKLQQQLERLRAIKGVKYAVPDHRIYPHRVDTTDKQQQGEGDAAVTLAGLSSRESFKFQWGAARIGLPDAWAIATGAASPDKAVTLCVVDSGVDTKHPDLAANLKQGYNAVNGGHAGDPTDEVGHGTTVHGVIAASGEGGAVLGVNWDNINILPCKFMSSDGWGQTSDAIQCMDWCLEQKADIISASWSCGEVDNPPLEEAVGRTKEAGVLMVIAAGNQGADLHKTPYYPQSYATTYDTVLVVGATDEYDEHAFFSNYDPKTVHLSAPGHWIYSTTVGGSYNFSSGTSIAAPFVSGSAALLAAAAKDKLGRSLSALELKAALMDSAEQLEALAGRSATGARLRTDWALQKQLGKDLSPPAPCVPPPGNHHKCSGSRRHHKKKESSGDEESGRRRSRRMHAAAVPAF